MLCVEHIAFKLYVVMKAVILFHLHVLQRTIDTLLRNKSTWLIEYNSHTEVQYEINQII